MPTDGAPPDKQCLGIAKWSCCYRLGQAAANLPLRAGILLLQEVTVAPDLD